MPLNVPNLLTWLRILLIPLFVGVFYFEKSWVSEPNQNLVATIIFTAACACKDLTIAETLAFLNSREALASAISGVT